jgi:chromosome segregation ATPase
MYHLNLSLNNIKEEVSAAATQNKILQNEVNKRDFHVQELQAEVAGLKEKLAENENMILHRNTEEVKRLNQEIKHIETAREFEENRLKTLVKTFEAKVDQLTQENFATNEKLM